MAQIFPGRFTAQANGDFAAPFVVFLIGFRINRIFALRRWTTVFAAMPPMIAELKRDPSLGMIHAEFFLYWRGAAVVEYWRSFELLHAYAHARASKHLPAWAEFNRRIGGDGSVGVWHETYVVAPDGFEAIYANMPRFGLAAAGEHVPATGRLESARTRIGRPSAGPSNESGEQR